MKKLLPLAAVVSALVITPVHADIYYVTARPQPSGAGANQTNCPSCDYTEVSVTLGDVGAKSSVTGSPSRSGCRGYLASALLTNPSAGVDIAPKLQGAGAVYQVDYTFSSAAGNVSTDAVFSVTGTGCTPSFATTDKFQSKYGTNGWLLMGYITNDVGNANPVLSFRYLSGDITAANPPNHRWLIDCFRFTLVTPCLSVAVPNVVGPLAAGAASKVTVTGVNASATAVTVYQDSGSGMVPIGTATTGIAATTIVNCTNLVKGAQASATQTVGGQESCVQNFGTLVGGGANPRLRFALSVRYAPALTGPIGANGTGTSCIWYLGATNVLSGSAPGDAKNVLYPSNTWQTLIWQRDSVSNSPPDNAVIWNNSGCGATLDGQYGILESLAIAQDDISDTGPIELYIDNIMNGGTVIQDFESAALGTAATFEPPSYSGTTSANILSTPNVSMVTNSTADTGAQSLRVSFQFKTLGSNQWVRLTTSAAAGTPNPEIDLTQPISMRVLMLPVGATIVTSPKMSVSQSNGQVTINWNGIFRLQYKNSLSDANWTDTGVTNGPYLTTAAGARYYRLQGQ